MNPITKIMTVAIIAGVLIGTLNFSTIAFAAKPADPNCFGDSASDLAGAGTTDKEDNKMGDHSREGSVAGDAPFDGSNDDEKPGREGIGNVGGQGSETHPSDLADALGGDCD